MENKDFKPEAKKVQTTVQLKPVHVEFLKQAFPDRGRSEFIRFLIDNSPSFREFKNMKEGK